MQDRTILAVFITVVLTALAVFINWDFVNPDYQYPEAARKVLRWQGEDLEQRDFKLRQGLDLQGGLQVLLQAKQNDVVKLGEGDLNAAANIIKSRVDALGVSEPQVLTQGEDKISVELPGIKNPEQAVRTIGETAVLEFVYAANNQLGEGQEVYTSRPVLFQELDADKQVPFQGDPDDYTGRREPEAEDDPDAADDADAADEESTDEDSSDEDATDDESAGEEDAASEDDEELPDETIYPVIITGDNVKNALVQFDSVSRQPVVSFELDADGAKRMGAFTGDHIDEIMAIVLDGKVVSAPAVRAKIVGQGQISGNFTPEEADSLAVQIKSGSLPVPLKVVGQNVIGATLGSETVSTAIRGGIIGFLAVMAFMLLYYRMPGLIADFALIIYALLTLAVFRVVPVTLTLAGIAGFVLSIGMAVDANILIFERMKEELRSGRRIGSAMEIGFSRAWPSIRDSNISSLITCAILFWFGNQFGASIVKGFAVTLALGIMVSLFTAITVTRSFLQLSNKLVLKNDDANPMEDPKLKTLFGF